MRIESRQEARGRPKRRNLRTCGIVALALLGIACAKQRPVLYPNAQYQRVGHEVAMTDTAACLQYADSTVGNTNSAARTVGSTLVGGAVGATVGVVVGAITGRPGRGAAIGAGGGGASGLARGVLSSRRNDPVFERFVERCLRDQDYETIGWR